MSQLRVTSSMLNGNAFPLDGEYFTIGRDPSNIIHINHTSVSKHHAMLIIDGDDYKLFDLHSTNGVIVNGERRVVAHLRDDDKVALGDIELRFETGSRTVTQLMSPFPPLGSHPTPTAPPRPPSVPSPVVKKEAPLKTPGLFARLLSTFRGKKTAADAPKASASPSREEIRTELSQTFGKMGLEMPKPPPVALRKRS